MRIGGLENQRCNARCTRAETVTGKHNTVIGVLEKRFIDQRLQLRNHLVRLVAHSGVHHTSVQRTRIDDQISHRIKGRSRSTDRSNNSRR